MDRPIFEVTDGDKHYKIWYNGEIEGFGEDATVINRIPTVMIKKAADYLSKLRAPLSPASHGSSPLGASQGTPEYLEISADAMVADAGEK